MSSIPHSLAPRNYDAIQERMAGTYNPLKLSAYTAFVDNTYNLPSASERLHDWSLTSQLRLADTSGADMILFTALSAIPVADAVRAYYDAFDRPRPILSHVMVKYINSHSQSAQSINAYIQRSEITRLRRLAAPDSKVCIVDQFVATGTTMNNAVKLVRAAAFTSISAMSGRWFHNAPHRHVDLDNLTSKHATFFQSVGHLMAEQVATPSYI